MENIALIPARGGSKGIPRKNIVPVGGKPLIEYTIDAAIQSKIMNRVIVSTDCCDIANVARAAGAEILMRPSEISTDSATTDSVIDHTIAELGISSDFMICLLQPTSPLRSSEHVIGAMSKKEENADFSLIMSVCQPSECVFKALKINEKGRLEGYFGRDFPFRPRQSFDEVYMPNGAIYIFSKNDFLESRRIPRTEIVPYIMDFRSSIDIDVMEDIAIAEAILNQFDRL